VLFTEALTLVQHELPRSKVGAHACAEITAYVDGLNTEFEKMCAEQKDLIANDDSMHQQLLLSSTAVGAHEEMKQKVEELEATLIKKDTDNTTLETSRLADQTTNCVYTRTPSIPLRKPSNKGGCPRSLIMGSLCYAWVCMGIYRYM